MSLCHSTTSPSNPIECTNRSTRNHTINTCTPIFHLTTPITFLPATLKLKLYDTVDYQPQWMSRTLFTTFSYFNLLPWTILNNWSLNIHFYGSHGLLNNDTSKTNRLMTLPDPLFTTTLYTIKTNRQTKWSTTFYSNTPTHTYRNSKAYCNPTKLHTLLLTIKMLQHKLVLLNNSTSWLPIRLQSKYTFTSSHFYLCQISPLYPASSLPLTSGRETATLERSNWKSENTGLPVELCMCGCKTKHGVLINRRGGQLRFESSW